MVDFGTFKSNKELDIFDRSVEVADFVVKKSIQYSPKLITLEGLAFGMRGDATRDLAGLQFTIINALRERPDQIPVKIISPKTLKKFATESGKANKVEMIERLPKNIREQFEKAGFKKTTGLADLADAYWLAAYAENLPEV